MKDSLTEEYCKIYEAETGNTVSVENCEFDLNFMDWLIDYLNG